MHWVIKDSALGIVLLAIIFSIINAFYTASTIILGLSRTAEYCMDYTSNNMIFALAPLLVNFVTIIGMLLLVYLLFSKEF